MKLSGRMKAIMEDIGDVLETISVRPHNMVIYLDDDPMDLMAVKRMSHGCNVVTLSSSEEFETIIRENGEKTLLIDIRLDGENGIDVAEDLEVFNFTDNVIFTSGINPDFNALKRINLMGGKFVLKENLSSELGWDKH